MEHFATTLALVGIVIVLASLVSGAIDRTGVPLVAVFLVLGAALGPWGLGVADITLASPILQTLATLALALVLFSDAVTLDMAQVRAHGRLAWRLIGPGTLLPGALIALAAWWLLRVPWLGAAIVGAALASTDPVILRSLLRSRAVPTTTRVALRLESGANDVVLLPIVVVAMLLLRGGDTPGGTIGQDLGRSLIGLFLLGPALGAAVGWLGIMMLVRLRGRFGVRRDYESLYALGLAFSGYAAAEAVGGSGFLAAFAAGLMVAAQDVELCDCFLEYGEATAEMFLLLAFVALGTSLIWTGLTVADWRTLSFAAVALSVRTLVLFPLLRGCGPDARDRRLIALFGPRGLSSLLLTLLPVFAGVPGADYLFTVTCLVVLVSVLVHGTGIAIFLRRSNVPQPRSATGLNAARPDEVSPETSIAREGETAHGPPERITLDELREMWRHEEPVIIADVRADRSYGADNLQAAGAVRLHPDDPVSDAQSLRLSQHSTLVLYCA
jgi:NhaP-type Na+/H+ or K+/H+ antiporter